MPTFSGAWPALVTPFTDDDEVNDEVLAALVEHLVGRGAGGLYACGSTGQGLLLTVEERRRAAEVVLAQAAGRVPVIVHVGSAVLPDAIALARHAAEHGAAGVSSVIPPLFTTLESISAYYRRLAGAVPGMPFFPYLFTGQQDAVALLRALDDLPNLAGAKYTGPDMFELSALLELRRGDWTIFSGMDQQCAYAAMAGSPGNIGSTLNHYPGAYSHIHRCVAAGDLAGALAWQERANRATRVMATYGFFGALWEGLRMLGFECGAPRLPARALSVTEAARFRIDLEAAGFWELAEA
jgi:dihydrodipicolinate synthase/N-acetylneuraminate lyase